MPTVIDPHIDPQPGGHQRPPFIYPDAGPTHAGSTPAGSIHAGPTHSGPSAGGPPAGSSWPPAHPAPAPRRPWGMAVASAALAAVVSAGVAVPIARSTADDAAVAQIAAEAVGGESAGEDVGAEAAQVVAAEQPEDVDLPISQIAADVAPSVARVGVIGPRGQGSGSAVVYDADGILVTNNHVVAGATDVEVTLPSGQSHPAQVVGTDPTTDLAVLRIDATDLPAVQIATDEPEIGDAAIAIGSPFGLEGSVTTGIVSATNRTLDGQGGVLGDLIQTDASINPGNSGGALVNGQGQLIGINTAILSASGTSSGVGFAVPVTSVTDVADQILQTGTVVHAALGVAGQTIDPQTAQSYGLQVEAGAAIAQVQPGSAAEAAGLQRGDIVTAVDGQPVTSIADLSVAVRANRPGDEITLDVVRDGRQTSVEVTLGEATPN